MEVRMTRSIAVALAAGLLWAPTRPLAQGQLFPNTKQRGQATVEYKDDRLQVVANYDYSQRRHESSWLLVDVAASSKRPGVINRDDVALITPSGSRLMVAGQTRFLEDSQNVTKLVQNAKVWRRQLDSYFNQRGRNDHFQFLALPGQGLAIDSAVLNDDRVTIGEVFFDMTSGGWDAGTYSLVIDLKDAHAALPITLQ
jgi:hypothetical protein